MTVKYVCLVFLFLMLSVTAHAVNGRTTYQARIVKPDGYPLEASSVFFRFTVLDPTGSCVLFVEDYPPANMTGSGGLISFALGSGSRTYPASGTMTFAKVFDNAEPIFTCQTPAVYNPISTDNRKIVMQFNDGNGWQTLPAMAINAVPYAMYAGKSDDSKTLNNKLDTAFVEYSTLASLNCQSNEAIKFNGVSFGCIAISSATVVTSGTVITALGYTPADGASVTAVSSEIFSVSSTVSSLAGNVSTLQASTAASLAAITSSQWNNVASGISYLSGNVGVGTSAPTSMLHVESSSNPPVLFVRNNSANNSTMTAAAVKAKTTGAIFDGYGVGLSFRIEGSGVSETTYGSIGYVRDGADNNSKINFNNINAGTVKTPMVIASSGNVGIGTTTPVTKLEVSGGVRISMESAACAVSYAGTLRYNAGSVEFCNGSTWSAFGVSGAGLQSLNGSTSGTQTFATGTAGNWPAFVTANGVHTLNIPLASTAAVTAGLISNADYQNFNNKITSSAASISQVLGYTPASASALGNYLVRANNLSDLTSSATARTNLGVGYIGTLASVDLGSSDVSGTLAVARTPSYIGDVTKAAASNTLVLSNSGVTAGTYTKVTVDAKGRVTSSSSLASSDVTTALGYTPAASGSFTSSQWNTNGTSINYMLGNVGIGTSVPTTTLDVRGTMNVYQAITEGLPTWNAAEYFRFVGNGNSAYHTDISVVGGTAGEAGIVFGDKDTSKMGGVRYMNSSDRLELLANGGTQMTITASGNVGIGTTAPAATLHVQGTGRFANDVTIINPANPRLSLGTGTSPNNGRVFYDTTNLGLALGTDTAASALFVANAGNVGIGTLAPSARLHLAAGTTSKAPLLITSGTLLTTAQDGAIEYDGTNLYYTDSTNTRRALASTGGGSGQTFSGTNTFNGVVNVSNNTASTNSSTGALVVSGGAGIGGALNVAGAANFGSTLNVTGQVSGSSRVLATSFRANQGAPDAGDNSTVGYAFGADGDTGLFSPGGGAANGVLAFYSNDSEKMRITTAGNVGIGTTNPTATLTVSGSGIVVDGASGASYTSGIKFNNTGFKHMSLGMRGTNFVIADTSTLGTQVWPSTVNERMVIDSTGNVGIGTTSPGYKLDVASTSRIAGDLHIVNMLRSYGGNLDLKSATGDIVLSPNTSELMRLTASGNVGIGTATPSARLAIESTAAQNSSALYINRGSVATGVSTTVRGIYVNQNGANDSAINEGIYVNAVHNIGNNSTGINANATTVYAEGIAVAANATKGVGAGPGNVYGVKAATTSVGANTAGYVYAGYFNNAVTSGTNLYGIYVNSAVTGSNNYGIYQAGSTQNYFSGNVGLGTTVPTARLEVYENSTSTEMLKLNNPAAGANLSNKLGFYQGANQNGYVDSSYETTNGWSLRFGTRISGLTASEKMILTSTGNVGIGVANPSAKLHLASGTTTNASLKIMSGTLLTTAQDGAIEYDGTNLYYTDSTNTRRALASTGGGSGQTFSGTNTFTGVVNVSNNTASTNSSTGALVVSGGVGVGGALNAAGAVSFGSTLNVTGQVSGSSRVLATGFRANQGVPDSNDSSTNGYAFGADGDTGLFSPGSGAANGVLAFYSNNSEKMRVTASGNVGIGTTSPGHALHIANTVANGEVALNVENLSATSGSALLRAKNQNRNWAIGVRGDTSDILTFQDDTAGAIRMAINSSGNVGIGTTSPGYKLTVPAAINVGDAAAGSSQASLTPLIHSYLGTSGDIGSGSTIYILLAYNQSAGSGINTSGFDGEIYAYRGSAGSWNNAAKYDIALKTAYNGPGLYRFNTSGPMANAQIVTLTYGGTSYVALQTPANSSQDIYFSGRFWGFKPILLDSVNHGGSISAVTAVASPYMSTFMGANAYAANVGIGTGSPNTKFVVNNGTTFNPVSNVSAAVTLQGSYGGALVFNDTKNIGLWSSNAGQTLNFATNATAAGFGAAQMVIDNGNVGIGATVPGRKLHVANTGSAEFVLEQTDAKTDYKKWNFVVDAGNATTASNFYIRQLNDALGGGTVPFSINGTSGYVSLGTGLTFAPATGDPGPTITTRTVPAGQGAANEKTELILFHSNDPANGSGSDQITLRAPALSFQTYDNATVASISDNNGYNERMYIAPSGNVGIGTTAPSSLLHVNGSILANAITGGQLNGAGNFHLDAWSSGADRSVYLNWNSGTGGAKIGNGSQTWGPISASAFNTSSDRRLKENIRPIPYALEKVLQLDAVTFTWKDQSRHKQEGERLGLIAQNVEKIFPQAVRVDHGENTLPGGTKLVTYPDLVAPLIAAIKELYHKWVDDSKQLHETVEQQAREIASVKEENKQLKAENAKTKQQNDQIKAYLCSKDPAAPICK